MTRDHALGRALSVSAAATAGILALDAVTWACNPMHFPLTAELFAQLIGFWLVWTSASALLIVAAACWLQLTGRLIVRLDFDLSPASVPAVAMAPLLLSVPAVMTQSRGLGACAKSLGPKWIVLAFVLGATWLALSTLVWLFARIALYLRFGNRRLARLGATASLGAILLGASWAGTHLYVGIYRYPHAALVVLQVVCLFSIAALMLTPRSPRPQLRSARDWVVTLVALVLGLALTATARRTDTLERLPFVHGMGISSWMISIPTRALGLRLPDMTPVALTVPSAAAEPLGRETDSCRHAVIVVVDAVRADHTGLSGYGRPTTPVLDALARRGLMFSRAVASSPSTMHSVPSLLLGAAPLLHRRLLAMANVPALPNLLRTSGFDTYCEVAIGLLREYGAAPEQLGCTTVVPGRRSAATAVEFAAFLAEHNADRERVFGFIHLFDAHAPYRSHPGADFGESEVDLYDSGVRAVDRQLGEILEMLDAGGYLQSTCLVVTADHGEALKEHGGYAWHSSSLFAEQVDVPLVLVAPGIEPGASSVPVDSTAIARTILEGVAVRAPRWMSRGLQEAFRWRADSSDVMAFAFAPDIGLSMITDGRYKLIESTENLSVVLFDKRQDPRELNPANRSAANELARLRGSLEWQQRMWQELDLVDRVD